MTKACDECGKDQVQLLTSGPLYMCEDCYYHHDDVEDED